jgi:hypothetical protein
MHECQARANVQSVLAGYARDNCTREALVLHPGAALHALPASLHGHQCGDGVGRCSMFGWRCLQETEHVWVIKAQGWTVYQGKVCCTSLLGGSMCLAIPVGE